MSAAARPQPGFQLTLEALLGPWRIARRITHGDGAQASFEGTASWTAAGQGADYVERGDLVMPGQGRFQAERRYFWSRDLDVFFDDGRFFHRVPAAGGAARHWCAPDQYDARYDFSGWPDWSCLWHVKGPRKDYRLQSVYTRQAA